MKKPTVVNAANIENLIKKVKKKIGKENISTPMFLTMTKKEYKRLKKLCLKAKL